MSTNPGSDVRRTALAAAGFLLLPVLCCGLPVLIAAGLLGAVGSVLGSPWVIGAAIAVVLAATAWFARRRITATRHRASQHDSCCPPIPPDHGHSDQTRTPSTDQQES